MRGGTYDRTMPLRYPRPLVPGDRIGVTAPSSGVAPELRPRLHNAVKVLQDKGFEVVLGECLGTPSHVSGMLWNMRSL